MKHPFVLYIRFSLEVDRYMKVASVNGWNKARNGKNNQVFRFLLRNITTKRTKPKVAKPFSFRRLQLYSEK